MRIDQLLVLLPCVAALAAPAPARAPAAAAASTPAPAQAMAAAISAHDHELVAHLLAGGFDLETPLTMNGETALMDAAAHSSPRVVAVLLDAGASVRATDGFGWTALSHAAAAVPTRDGHAAERMSLLLQNGAQPRIERRDGGRALDLELALGAGSTRSSPALPPAEQRPERLREYEPPIRRTPRFAGNVAGPTDPWRTRVVLQGDADRVRLLLEAGLGPLTHPTAKARLVELAATVSDAERFRLILDAGVDVLADPVDRQLVLAHCCEHGTAGMVAEMLRRGADPAVPVPGARRSLLEVACHPNHGREPATDAGEKARLLLDAGFLGRDRAAEILLAAIGSGDGAAVTHVIDAGIPWLASPEARRQLAGDHLRRLAAEQSDDPGLAAVLALTAPSVTDPLDPAHAHELLAAAAGSLHDPAAKVRRLLQLTDDRVPAGEPERSAVLAAAAAGNFEALVVLLEAGASIARRASDGAPRGTTALDLVARGGTRGSFLFLSPETPTWSGPAIRALVARGAALEVPNAHGHTPMAAAAFAGNPWAVRALCDLGADPNPQPPATPPAPDVSRFRVVPPLTCAIEQRDLDLAVRLLAAGADPDPAAAWSELPLVAAVDAGLESVALLLAAGADPTRADSLGRPLLERMASTLSLPRSAAIRKALTDAARAAHAGDDTTEGRGGGAGS